MAPPRDDTRPDRRRRRSIRPHREHLEVRVVPALVGSPPILAAMTSAATTIRPAGSIRPAGGSGSPVGYTPQQIRTAYGFDRVAFGSLAGDGAGQTIAIVDAYDDPGLVDRSAANFAASDLAAFDRQFGLPDPPGFTKLNQYGGTTGLPGTDPAGPGSPSGNWEFEEAMDVEWAHALAPSAKIVLVEANSSGFSDLYAAISTADHLSGVSTVSLSWGSSEFSAEINSDRNFQTPNHHQGVTFVAAAGDGGAPGLYPAFSPDVLAVGGTTLQLNPDGSIQAQTAWSSGGGGASRFESRPAYQAGVQDTGARTSPDVSFLADRSVGVAVYDSYDDTGGGPWTSMGGTSLGAPAWAALIAIADQGRVADGGTTLDGATQTIPALYSLPSADFHDVTAGANGSNGAGPGYDQVTGLGTPAADLLAPDLAFYGMADHLVITAQPPAAVAAGQAFGLTVEVERPDGSLASGAGGSITISLVGNPGGASLGGTLTATVDGGIATFTGLAVDQAGAGDSVFVSGAGLGSVTSSPFEVTPAAPTALVVAAQPPTSVTAGGQFGLTVDVEDAFGNLATGFSGTVTVALEGGPAGSGLGGTVEVGATGGVASFSDLSIDQSGSGYTIQAKGASLASADSSTVAVTPAVPAQLVLGTAPPTSVTAGEGFGLSVSVEDAYGNLETGYGGEVTIGLVGGPAGAILGGTLSGPAVDGVATFSGLELTEAGSGYAIAASSGSLPAARSGALAVTPAAPAKLAITQSPSAELVAGSPFNLGVSVEDAFGNIVPGAENPIHLGLLGGASDVGLGGTPVISARGGVATFEGLVLDAVGSHYVIQASSPGLVGSATSALVVRPSSPTHLVITAGPPASVTAGDRFVLGVTAEDAYGNVVTGFEGTVGVSLDRGPAGVSLSGDTTAAASQGVATFSGLTLDKAAGAYTLEVVADGVGSAATNPFRVAAAAPSQLVIVDQPPGQVAAGQSFGLSVAAEDPYGNATTGFNGPVTATLAADPSGGSLSGAVTRNAVNGIATFSGLALDKAGAGDAIRASSGGLSSTTSMAMRVVPAAPSRLIIIAQPPASVLARRPFAIGVEAVDDYGNVATSFDGTVSASLATDLRHNRLGGTLSVQANGGRAVITDATLDRAGKSYEITITSGGLTPAATSVFNVTRPAAAGFAGAVRLASRPHLRGSASSPAPAPAHLPKATHRHSLEGPAVHVHGRLRGGK